LGLIQTQFAVKTKAGAARRAFWQNLSLACSKGSGQACGNRFYETCKEGLRKKSYVLFFRNWNL